MTTLAHTQLVTAVVALLQASPAICDGGVHRCRGRRMADGVTGMVVVRVKKSAPEDAGAIFGGPVDYTTLLDVESYAVANGAQSADEAADSIFQACLARLMTDPTLGGQLLDLKAPHLAWDDDDSSERFLCATVGRFEALHRTDSNLQGMT